MKDGERKKEDDLGAPRQSAASGSPSKLEVPLPLSSSKHPPAFDLIFIDS